MITRDSVISSRQAALAFIARCDALLDVKHCSYEWVDGHYEWVDDVPWQHLGCPKETGAVRRASMDLTRSLADLRRS